MTDEQINIAIAESLGWTQCKAKPCAHGIMPNVEFTTAMLVPSYCSNLNEMHGVEQNMTTAQADQYNWELRDITKLRGKLRSGTGGKIWHATARQRAEAFLRTLNKWQG